MSPLQRGEDWYRSRIDAGHDNWRMILDHRRLPVLRDEDWLPLDELRNVADPDVDVVEQVLELERAELVRAKLACLFTRQRFVLEARYGLDERPEQTLEEVGLELDVTRERVRQIQREAENRLCDLFEVPRIHAKRAA